MVWFLQSNVSEVLMRSNIILQMLSLDKNPFVWNERGNISGTIGALSLATRNGSNIPVKNLNEDIEVSSEKLLFCLPLLSVKTLNHPGYGSLLAEGNWASICSWRCSHPRGFFCNLSWQITNFKICSIKRMNERSLYQKHSEIVLCMSAFYCKYEYFGDTVMDF